MPSLRHLHELNRRLDATLHQFEKLDLGYSYDEMYPTSCGLGSSGDKKTQYPSLYVPRTKQDVMDIPETGRAVVEYVLTGRNMSKRDGKTSYGMDLQIKSFDPQGTKKADAKKKADGVAVEMSSHAFARGDQIAAMAKRVARLLPGHRKMDALERSVIKRGRLAKKAYTAEGLQVIRDGMAKNIKGVRSIRFPKEGHQFSDRTRNGDGQFVGNVTGGADPVTMRQAYGHKSLLAPGAGAAALAGAGLLGTQAGRGMTIKAAKGAARMVRSSVAGLDRKLKGKTGSMWPRMGSKAKPKQREGLGEVIIRQSAKGKTGARMPRFGD